MNKLITNQNIAKLKDNIKEIAEVFLDEVSDNIHDNGNLSLMTDAIAAIENVIAVLEKRDDLINNPLP